MRIEFTVRGPSGMQDVAVVGGASTCLADVAPDLARAAGAEAGTAMWRGSRPLPDTARIDEHRALCTGMMVDLDATPPPSSSQSLLDLVVAGGPHAGERHPLPRGRVIIGRGTGCGIRLVDDRVSRRHATLEVDSTGTAVRDLGSTNGTTIDGAEVGPDGTPIGPLAVIRIGDSLLRVAGPVTTTALVTVSGGSLSVNRGPRPPSPAPPPPIEVPVSNRPARPGRVQWVTALLPALAGGVMAWVLDAPIFLLFALLSPMMILSSSLGDRLHWRRSRRVESVRHREALTAAQAAIDTGLRTEAIVRRQLAPDPVDVASTAAGPGVRIWERRRADTDHLRVRIGCTDGPSHLQIRTGTVPSSAGVVASVPMSCDLRAGPLGLAGPTELVNGIARWVLAQLATLHAPSDLEIVAVLADPQPWAFARWLPHLPVRPVGDPEAQARTLAAVADLLERRRSDRRRTPGPWTDRWTVLLVDGAAAVQHASALKAVLSEGPAAGITAVVLVERPDWLPGACRSLVLARPDGRAQVTVRSPDGEQVGIADQVSVQWAEQVTRSLAPLLDPGGVADRLPDSCRLTDLLVPTPT